MLELKKNVRDIQNRCNDPSSTMMQRKICIYQLFSLCTSMFQMLVLKQMIVRVPDLVKYSKEIEPLKPHTLIVAIKL